MAKAHAVGDGDVAARLDRYLAPFVESRDFSGVILLERDGETSAALELGLASYELEVPHRRDSLYWAGSISKLFTQAALLALAQDGVLRLDEPLAEYLPDYPGSSAISLQMLVDHRAGIARDLFLGTAQTEPHTTQEIVDLVAAVPPIAEPGEAEAYSNNGYRILARVIEVAAGAEFAAVVRDTVFAPRGMDRTLAPDLLDVVPGMASGYVAAPGVGTLRRAAPYNVLNEPGAGGFYSTPADLLTFARTLPLEPGDLVRGDTTPDGWEVPPWTGHNGLGHGFAAYCYRFPDDDASMVMMANIETGLFGRLRDDLVRMLFGQPVDPPPPPPPAVHLDRAAAERVVGDYEFMPGAPLSVRLGSDGLELSAGDFFHPLVAVGADHYFMRLKFAYVRFPPGQGAPPLMVWQQDGQEYQLARLS